MAQGVGRRRVPVSPPQRRHEVAPTTSGRISRTQVDVKQRRADGPGHADRRQAALVWCKHDRNWRLVRRTCARPTEADAVVIVPSPMPKTPAMARAVTAMSFFVMSPEFRACS